MLGSIQQPPEPSDPTPNPDPDDRRRPLRGGQGALERGRLRQRRRDAVVVPGRPPEHLIEHRMGQHLTVVGHGDRLAAEQRRTVDHRGGAAHGDERRAEHHRGHGGGDRAPAGRRPPVLEAAQHEPARPATPADDRGGDGQVPVPGSQEGDRDEHDERAHRGRDAQHPGTRAPAPAALVPDQQPHRPPGPDHGEQGDHAREGARSSRLSGDPHEDDHGSRPHHDVATVTRSGHACPAGTGCGEVEWRGRQAGPEWSSDAAGGVDGAGDGTYHLH